MTSWSLLIFDESDLVRSRIEKCKNHSHTLKLKKSEVIFINGCPLMLDTSCTWIKCTRVSSWYSNGHFNSDLVETFKTNEFNASFNVFVLDRVIGPFGTCKGSLLVFLGWSTSSPLSSKGFDLESKSVSNNVRSETLKVVLTPYSPRRSILYALSLILSKTWNGPSPRGCNFDFLWLGNHSLHMYTQTQSPGWKTTSLRPLFALEA